MKTQNLAVAIVVIACLGAALPALNWAQEDEARIQETALREQERAMHQAAQAEREAAKAAARVRIDETAKQRKVFTGWTGPPMPIWTPGPNGMQRHLTQIEEAAKYYCDAKDEAGKDKALRRLHDLATKFFDEDMEVRKKELAEIEARLAKLRAQLDRRRAKKEEIVDLQVKVAINEAEGLGFTSVPRENVKFDVRIAPPMIAPPETRRIEVMAAPPSSDLFVPPVPVAAPAPAAAPVQYSSPLEGLKLLGFGAKGEAVRLLQKTLNEKLDPSPNLDVDGDFGPKTDKALKIFQAENDLVESGIVDDSTRQKLGLPDELPPFIEP